jgi:LmbE family N-acetylglucosaminyl deacetylase
MTSSCISIEGRALRRSLSWTWAALPTALALLHTLAPPSAAATEMPSADLPPIGPTTSLLVVSPHPDDETLCCAGVIQRVRNAGGTVSVVWITSGDGSEVDSLLVERSLFVESKKMRDLGMKRMQEARDAMAILGVPPQGQFFLGYPDRGLLPIITDNSSTPYRSSFTDTTRVPYAAALFPGHPYTGQSLEHDFATLLDRVRPTLILAPSPRDTHSDHSASGVLTMRVTGRRKEMEKVRYWIVHGGGGWPTPRGLERELEMTPPPRGAGMPLAPFRLEAGEEEQKLQALRAYRTQTEIMSSFLLAFVRTTELFSPSPVPQEPGSSR